MAAIDLNLIPVQPTPSAVDAVADSGGGYAADTYSFLVAARYLPSSTSDRDYYGLSAPKENVAVSLNDQVTVSWTAAADGAGNTRPPDYYVVLQQAAASWNYGSAATVVAVVAGSLLTAVLDDGASLGSLTLAAAHTAMSISPVLPLAGALRSNSGVGFNGLAYRPSYANDVLNTRLSIAVLTGSLTLANWKRLLKWAQHSVALRLEDADSTAYVQYYYGRVSNADYLASVWKDPRPQHSIEFLVERETRY
jgi:hypothetical protein